LSSQSWQVLRFRGRDIEKHIDICVQEVQDAILDEIIQKFRADISEIVPSFEEKT
jgi:very-short-patch-repair endonuclease